LSESTLTIVNEKEKAINHYDVKDTFSVSDRGITDVSGMLLKHPQTLAVVNVEKDEHFQNKDIDILWLYRKKEELLTKKIEVKTDRYAHTGNIFLETISNETKNTPGCFLYTEADWIFYYFIDSKELYILPVTATRKWFATESNRFREKRVSTSNKGEIWYYSRGTLVPKNILKKEVPGIKVVKL